MPITKREIEKIRDALDEDAKEAFLSMSREDQLTVILSMEASNSNRLAKVEKWQIDFEREARVYRSQRERRENSNEDEVVNITQKILKAIADADAAKFNVWVWFRDRVLPSVIGLITLGILYLVFGGRLP
jgi:hypothetical protein